MSHPPSQPVRRRGGASLGACNKAQPSEALFACSRRCITPPAPTPLFEQPRVHTVLGKSLYLCEPSAAALLP
eukprot:2297116-Rhodomonas_salina.1